MVVQKPPCFIGVMLASLMERLVLRLGMEFEPARLLGRLRAEGMGWQVRQSLSEKTTDEKTTVM